MRAYTERRARAGSDTDDLRTARIRSFVTPMGDFRPFRGDTPMSYRETRASFRRGWGHREVTGMTFTCDRCGGEYQADAATAVAQVFIEDRRCNHVVAHCSHCGVKEIIFLGGRQLEEVIRDAELPTVVRAEASPGLRIRAERAWLAAERKDQERAPGAPPAAIPRQADPAREGSTLVSRELTIRQQRLVESFGEALRNIPDDLLWDGWQGV